MRRERHGKVPRPSGWEALWVAAEVKELSRFLVGSRVRI